jgi:hypothetical protein
MALPARYNVIAAFPDERRARGAVRELTREGVDGSNVRLLRPSDRDQDQVSELRAEMRDEVAEGFAAPGVSFMTPRQAKGASRGLMLGGALGAIIGLAVGVAWAIGFDAAISPLARLFIAAIPFAVGGSIAGAVAGGALEPRSEAGHTSHRSLDDERMAAERDTVVAVHVGNKQTAQRAWRVLTDSGAERVDAVNADGTPLPPQSEHLRPADPADRWWEPGQSGG